MIKKNQKDKLGTIILTFYVTIIGFVFTIGYIYYLFQTVK